MKIFKIYCIFWERIDCWWLIFLVVKIVFVLCLFLVEGISLDLGVIVLIICFFCFMIFLLIMLDGFIEYFGVGCNGNLGIIILFEFFDYFLLVFCFRFWFLVRKYVIVVVLWLSFGFFLVMVLKFNLWFLMWELDVIDMCLWLFCLWYFDFWLGSI